MGNKVRRASHHDEEMGHGNEPMDRSSRLRNVLKDDGTAAGRRSQNSRNPVTAILDQAEACRTWFSQRHARMLQEALAFVPYLIMECDCHTRLEGDPQQLWWRADAVVVVADVIGFDKAVVELMQRSTSDGESARTVAEHLASFYAPVIELIHAYRGDIIKFDGGSILMCFQAFDDTQHPKYNANVPPHGTYGLRDLGPLATAVLRAGACCVEIHRRISTIRSNLPEGIDLGIRLGIGSGSTGLLHLGGVRPADYKVPRHDGYTGNRYEYLLVGAALSQACTAVSLAKAGETVLSPEAWRIAADWSIEGRSLGAEPPTCDNRVLEALNASKFTYPCVRTAAVKRDQRKLTDFKAEELYLFKKYMTSEVYLHIENGSLLEVNQIRNVTVAMVSIDSLADDLVEQAGANAAESITQSIQRVCAAYEGVLHKLSVDGKGLRFQIVFGLPPLVHSDDAARAVLACIDVRDLLSAKRSAAKSAEDGSPPETELFTCRYAITSGSCFCGLLGSGRRSEYTVAGSAVSLAVQLLVMSTDGRIVVDEATKGRCDREPALSFLPGDVATQRAATPTAPLPAPPVSTTPPPFASAAGAGAVAVVTPEDAPVPVQTFLASPDKGNTALGVQPDHRTVILPWPPASALFRGSSKLLSLGSWRWKAKMQELLRDQQCRCIYITGAPSHGTADLLELAVSDATERSGALPVFCTRGPQPGPYFQPLQVLLRSILAAFRAQPAQDLPEEDLTALKTLYGAGEPQVETKTMTSQRSSKASAVSEPVENVLHQLRADLLPFGDAMYPTEDKELLLVERGTACAISLLRKLLQSSSVMCILSAHQGSSVADSKYEAESALWTVSEALARLAEESSTMPNQLLLVCQLGRPLNECREELAKIVRKDACVQVEPLETSQIQEYVAAYLNVPVDKVPPRLTAYVTETVKGNALHIGQLIEGLKSQEQLVVSGDDEDTVAITLKENLTRVNLLAMSGWSMIDNNWSLLQSLDPTQQAIVKMASLFNGSMSLRDFSAVLCPQWAGGAYLDRMRVLSALTDLVRRGILTSLNEEEGFHHRMSDATHATQHTQASTTIGGPTPVYRLESVVLRKIARSMLREEECLRQKRQALVDRVLHKKLPAFMDELRRKRAQPYVPWYYQIDYPEAPNPMPHSQK
eukprot:TRINITY_DN20241_c0_g3_i2.p1 TRINITY_DN20241_c0_g3~~TRINITY_DN20241_c0_g3_i2.p1  ORF type:complete len:1153 (-),score=222.54 TRINITY_DN20241_c0_g3_i2:45-3503(-)